MFCCFEGKKVPYFQRGLVFLVRVVLGVNGSSCSFLQSGGGGRFIYSQATEA